MFFHARGIGVPDSSAAEGLYRVTEFGWFGVDLFFVLSGYLITGILLDTRDHAGYFRSFIARRALRILPLYYAVLILVTIALLGGFIDGSSGALPYFWTYLQNWLRLDGETYRIKMLAHFWSLAIEEQFYLFWPLLIWILPRRAIGWMCGGVVLAAAGARLLIPAIGSAESGAMYFLTPTRMDALAAGGLLAVAFRSDWLMVRIRLVAPVLVGLSIAVIAVITSKLGHFRPEDALTVTVGLSANTLLFVAVIALSMTTNFDGRWRRTLRHRRLAYLGQISYGAYVFHWPVMVLTAKFWRFSHFGFFASQLLYWMVTFTVTFVVAGLSYRFFERPLLRLKDRFVTRAARPAGPDGNLPSP
jgi:peptidoglycan/LPS O-acetylase OafA/YrhL